MHPDCSFVIGFYLLVRLRFSCDRRWEKQPLEHTVLPAVLLHSAERKNRHPGIRCFWHIWNCSCSSLISYFQELTCVHLSHSFYSAIPSSYVRLLYLNHSCWTKRLKRLLSFCISCCFCTRDYIYLTEAHLLNWLLNASKTFLIPFKIHREALAYTKALDINFSFNSIAWFRLLQISPVQL